MSKRLIPVLAAIVVLFSSCAGDEEMNGGKPEVPGYDGIVAEVLPMEDASQGSRSSLTFDAQKGMVFSWNDPDNNPDVLTVFPESGAASGQYTLSKMLDANNTLAQFTATGFSLSAGMRYYALSKKENAEHPTWRFPSAGNITFDYSGQRQTASGDNETSHLGEYDFMAATALCENQDNAFFAFKHLGLTLRMILKGLPANVEYTELEIYDSENTFRQPIRTIDISKGLDAEGNYTPAYNDLDPTSKSYNQRFKLALGTKDTGIIPTTDDGNSHKKIVAYIELPPFDFTGKNIVFVLKSKDGTNNYYGTYEGYKLNAGKAYQMTVNMQPASTYVVNVKVAYNWQHGNTVSRATGDPGNEEGFDAPNYIYAFFCVDGKVQTYKYFQVGNNSEVAQDDKANDAWTAPDQNNVITYKTPLVFSASNPTDASTARVYIAASRTALSIPGITEGTTSEKEVVRAIKYDMQDVATSPEVNSELDASQLFMRDLYSTPWDATNFVGKLKDPYQDIILYHVAAKVDLKWNSSMSLIYIDSEHPENNINTVSVNNVQSTNLSLFQPATVNGTSPFVGTNNYTVTSTIEADRQFYGRQVFYLPQMATTTSPNTSTYNVTIGNKAAEPVNFKPVTTDGYTSWLRWLRQYGN